MTLDVTTCIFAATTVFLLGVICLLYANLASARLSNKELTEKNAKYLRAIKNALVMAASCQRCGRIIKAYQDRKKDGKHNISKGSGEEPKAGISNSVEQTTQTPIKAVY